MLLVVKTVLDLQPRSPLTGVSRTLRNPERVSKQSPRAFWPGGSKKCPKQSQNSLRRLETVYFETPETVLRLFRTLFGPRAGRPRRLFGDSFGIPGPEGPGDSCKARPGLQCLTAKRLALSSLLLVVGHLWRVEVSLPPLHMRAAKPRISLCTKLAS